MKICSKIVEIEEKEYSRLLKQDEKNDCVVRALSEAANISYFESHKLFEKLGRKKYEPFKLPLYAHKIDYFSEIYDFYFGEIVYGAFNGKEAHDRVSKFFRCEKGGISCEKFIKDFDKGNFVVLVEGHGFAIKDGKIFGTNHRNKKIIMAFKIKEVKDDS